MLNARAHSEDLPRTEMIDAYLASISSSLKAPRQPVDLVPYRILHENNKFSEMVNMARKAVGLNIKFRIGYVNSGGPPNASAWVTSPKSMPMFGSKEFNELRIDIYIRKEFLSRATFTESLMAISHELSHVILDSIGHPLRDKEEAVDLTAMHLGFSEAYAISALDWRENAHRYGYLSPIEIDYAASKMHKGWNAYPNLRRKQVMRYGPAAAAITAFAVLTIAAIATRGYRSTSPQDSTAPLSDYATQQRHNCDALNEDIARQRPYVNRYDEYAVEEFNRKVNKFNSTCADQ